jgi:hypothetical protein
MFEFAIAEGDGRKPVGSSSVLARRLESDQGVQASEQQPPAMVRGGKFSQEDASATKGKIDKSKRGGLV